MCFFIELDRHVSHSERMEPIDFGGQRSKFKVTIDIYCNKFENMIETKQFVLEFIKLGRHVSHNVRMDPIDFGGQRSRSQLTCMEIIL